MPARGEIWLCDLEPVRGHEQGRKRPVLILSVDKFNNGPASLVIAIPLTTKDRKIPFHVPVSPPQGGLKQASFIMCDHLRSISKDRLIEYWGEVSNEVIEEVEWRVKILLGL